MTNKLNKLRRAVIKEELVELTGDYKKAIVLNQMLYWSERVKDYDKFLEDEKRRSTLAMNQEEKERAIAFDEMSHLLTHGWIYKSMEELAFETLINCSKSTMKRYLDFLVEKNWLDRRNNPHWKGDNTYQYRLNIINIQKDLQNLGYALEGYPLFIEEKARETPQIQAAQAINENELPWSQNETPTFYNGTSEFQNETSSFKIEQPISKQNNITKDYYKDYSKNSFEEEEENNINNINEPKLMNFDIMQQPPTQIAKGKNEQNATLEIFRNFYSPLKAWLHEYGITHKKVLQEVMKALYDYEFYMLNEEFTKNAINDVLEHIRKGNKVAHFGNYLASAIINGHEKDDAINYYEEQQKLVALYNLQQAENFNNRIGFYNWLDEREESPMQIEESDLSNDEDIFMSAYERIKQ